MHQGTSTWFMNSDPWSVWRACTRKEVRWRGAPRDVLPLAPGPDRDLALQPGGDRPLALRLPEEAPSVPAQQPVDGRRADLQQEAPHLLGQPQLAVALEGGEELRHDRRQELAAHSVAHFPQLHQGGGDLGPVASWPAPAWRSRPGPQVQQPDGGLPMHARGLTELIQDLLLHPLLGRSVAGPERSSVLVNGHAGHRASLPADPAGLFGNRTFEATLRSEERR